jgi:DNA-nicking Smr family endonuclease
MRDDERGVNPDPEADDSVELPIDGTLDLHTFHPRELKSLLPEYLLACRRQGIREVRIVHGKGTGALRESVHAILQRMPEVDSFRLAGEDRGSWGATLVILKGGPQEPPG